uniref:Uncharacterized protein n=1 Tax=Eutreptiella gymnastica TaxID=73025 RepID=A0A7S1JGL9_9EUGL
MPIDDGRHFAVPESLDSIPLWDDVTVEKVKQYVLKAVELCTVDKAQSKTSIYTGECGAALLFFKLATIGGWGDPLKLVDRAHYHLQNCINLFSPKRVATFLEGSAGALALQATVCHFAEQLGMGGTAKKFGERLLALKDAVLSMDPEENELLYGRCGYLHSLLFVRKHLGDPSFGTQVAQAVIQQVLNTGMDEGATSLAFGFPLMYYWHSKCYLGACHGLCGIMYTLLQFLPELQLLPDAKHVMSRIRGCVDALLVQTLPSGNLRSSLGSDRDKLVQWCHGAPGMVPLLILCADVFQHPPYLTQARAFGDIVWQRGLLRKGLGLCHGIAGNGYVHLSLFRATGDEEYLRRAQYFALFGVENVGCLENVPDRPYSMFEGLMGHICFCADVLNPQGSSFWGYEV